MTTFLFSAYFADPSKTRRIEYLERVLDAADKSTRFVAFNSSGHLKAAFDTVNAEDYGAHETRSHVDNLKILIDDLDPDGELGLWEQAKGEYEASGGSFPASGKKLARNVLAFVEAVNVHAPDYIFLWNQFNAFHTIAAAILRARGIRHGFFHDGVLPGSVVFDPDGEMGESWVSRRPDLLSKIKIGSTDRTRARDYYNFLRSGLGNRHPQRASINYNEALRHAGLEGRPIILYAGQNDWHAGVKPDTSRRLMHSPCFKGSLEALYALDAVARKMELAVVFKPHPLNREKFSFLNSGDFKSSLVLHSIDLNDAINQSSVVCTIASQAAYSGIFAGKPVLMLGRNQLTNKNLTYDVSDVAGLRPMLKKAIRDPLKSTREADIIDHMARLEKIYLFDFGTFTNSFFRRGPAAAAAFIHLCAQHSPERVVDALISETH